MAIIPLSNVQEWVEKSIYTSIRNNVVAHGYIPDSTLYPLTDAGQQQYLSARESILANRGYYIEVFGTSAMVDKEEKGTGRIVIEFDDFLPGNIGGGDVYYELVEQDSKYIMKMRPPKTSTYSFKLRLVANRHSIMRTMIALVAISLPDLGYIKAYDNSLQDLFIVNTGFTNFGGDIERVLTYEIRDLYAILPKVIDENIAKILSIDITTKIKDESFQWPQPSGEAAFILGTTGIFLGVPSVIKLGYIKKIASNG